MLEIVTYIMPTELQDLDTLVRSLKKASKYLSKEQPIKLNITMGVSSEIVDWENSTLSKGYAVDTFNSICENISTWVSEYKCTISEDISGCLSARREACKSDSKWYMWLDTDIVFDELSLSYAYTSVQTLEQLNITHFVLTPEIVRQWDSTWDCLVSKRFLSKPIGYQAKNNPWEDVRLSEYTMVALDLLRNNIPNQPYMKFAGGWMTTLSKPLLTLIPLPDRFQHYGPDDTYIMWAAAALNKPHVQQYKMTNLVVCENYYNRDESLKDRIKLIDRRNEYRTATEQVFGEELRTLLERNR